jgi:hypothetical protein
VSLVEVGFGVAVNGGPGDHDCLGEESERDGPLDGFLDAVGLADAVGLGFLVGGLDRPAAVVAGDQLGCGDLGVGRGERTSNPSVVPGLRIRITLIGRV